MTAGGFDIVKGIHLNNLNSINNICNCIKINHKRNGDKK